MPDHLTLQELQDRLHKPETLREDGFRVLQGIATLCNSDATESRGRELVLRALEHREAFADNMFVLEALVRRAGLFPYLDPQHLNLSDAIAYEFHRPANMDDEGVVFHEAQGLVYRE